jgi:succinyl-diaminopimelate desuccinylase
MTLSPDLELARRLIQLPSTPESGGEPRVAQLLADRLVSAGFTVSVDAYDQEHTNVVARWGDPNRRAICLSGHLDTVTVVEEDWSTDPYGAEIVGSRLYGRGAVDMKTGVAALVRAAEEYVASPPPDAVPVTLVLTAQEEVGSLGASALTREAGLLPDSRFLLIAEPTSNQPVLGHRGAVWLNLVAQGRSCHGSTPHLGENAIEKLVDALQAVRRWAADNEVSHQVLGRRTLNIGRVRGGVLRNIVPDAAVAELDFRTPLEEDAVTIADTLGELVEGRVAVERVLSLPPVYTRPADPWVRLVREVAGGYVELSEDPPVARFFTDASVLTGALGDVPTVICGPGSPDQAHVVDEWCEVDQVSAATAMYTDLLRAASQAAPE